MKARNIICTLDGDLLRIYDGLDLWYAIDCSLHINGEALGKLICQSRRSLNHE